MRLLITGSREWTHLRSMTTALQYLARGHFEGSGDLRQLLVVHGKAYKGADALAASWVARWRGKGWPVEQERHPADWGADCVKGCKPNHRRTKNGREFCPFAGFRRNQAMVDLGAQLCLAFWRDNSSGTKDCIDRARKAHIPVLIVPWDGRELVTDEWMRAELAKIGAVHAIR